MKKIKLSLLIAVSLLIGSCCKEGIGGDVTLTATLKHHSVIMVNHPNYPDTVFVKYNTNQLPGTRVSDFDTYFVGTPGENYVHIHGLKCGNYYLYAVGIDSAGPYRVTGGIPLKINYGERKEAISVDIPVTE